MKRMNMSECTRQNTCYDCTNTSCTGHGDKGADCPKWRCDEPGMDCERCGFIDRYIREMREFYG